MIAKNVPRLSGRGKKTTRPMARWPRLQWRLQIPNQLVIFFLKCMYYHFGCRQFSLQITKCLKYEFMFLKCQNKKSAPFITEIILRRIRATVIDAS